MFVVAQKNVYYLLNVRKIAVKKPLISDVILEAKILSLSEKLRLSNSIFGIKKTHREKLHFEVFGDCFFFLPFG